MTMPIRKVISPMMPSARTPTTSKRWTTALRRKRLRALGDVVEADQRRAEEAEQAAEGLAGLGDPFAKLLDRAAETAAALLGDDPHRAVGVGDLVEQAADLLAFADDRGAAIAHRAIDQPGADRIHLLDPAEVDRHAVGHGGDLALGGGGAKDGQRAHAAIAMVGVIVAFTGDALTGHRRARLREIAWSGKGNGRNAAIPPLSCRTLWPIGRGRWSNRPPPRPAQAADLRAGRRAIRRACSGSTPTTRARRLAAKAKLDCADAARPGQAVLLADLDFAWDPAWLAAIAKRPGSVLMLGDRAVLAHVPAHLDAAPMAAAMEQGAAWTGSDLDRLDAETTELNNHELRKRERPFVLPLDAADPEPVERAAYDASYKGVTDFLTLYLWRRLAFHLTRWAAQGGHDPQPDHLGRRDPVRRHHLAVRARRLLARHGDRLRLHGARHGRRQTGALHRPVVDSGAISSTMASTSIHPPFWWWAWAEGLNYHGDPFERVYEVLIVLAIVGGYVVQRFVEGIFMRKFGMHIHVWQPLDSRFRLVTARRNPNMIILLVSLVFRRPDMGLELVALWTMISLIFHCVRLAQANARAERGQVLRSWLA